MQRMAFEDEIVAERDVKVIALGMPIGETERSLWKETQWSEW